MQKISCLNAMRCAIFDMDGTLSDSAGVWEEFVVEVLRRHHIQPPPGFHDDLKTKMAPQVPRFLIDTLHLSVSEADLADFMYTYLRKRYRDDVSLKPGAKQYLQALHARGIPLCIASASSETLFSPVLEKYDIRKLFDFVLCCDEVGVNKDSPDVYLACARRYHLSPGECAVFEDSRGGVRTAFFAGFYTVAIADACSLHLKDEILSMCDVYVDSFAELPSAP